MTNHPIPVIEHPEITTTFRYGGDVILSIRDLLTDVDLSPLFEGWRPKIYTQFLFRSGKLAMYDEDLSNEVHIVVDDITNHDGNVTLHIPAFTDEDDTILLQNHPQQINFKILGESITVADDIEFNENAILNAVISGDDNTITNIPDSAIVEMDYDKLINIPSNLVHTDEANEFGNFEQLFQTGQLKLKPSSGSFLGTFVCATLESDRIWTMPNATGTIQTGSNSSNFSNKNISLSTNTVTDSSIATGDIPKSNGSKFVRFARGSEGQVLKSTDSDLEWDFVDWSELTNVPEDFPPSDHDHDADYAAISHTHSWADITSGTAPKLDDLTAPDDNTDLNASTTKHGLLPKLSGTATQYLNGEGNWTTPAGGEGGGSISLAGLTDDVDIDTPTDGQILEYSDFDNKWHNVANSGGGAEALDDLTDVTITTPSDGHIIEYDDGDWVNIAHDHSGEFAVLGHNHDSAYSAISHHHDSDYADIDHDHDEDYSTISHNHDATYAALSHNHSAANITSGTLAVARGGTGKSTFTQHALLKGGTSNSYDEIVVGQEGYVLAVVSGTPAWKSLDSERTGKATADGDGSTTQFTIAHGLGSTPSYVFVDCSSHAIARTFTVDGTNITVEFVSPPDSGSDNVIIYWRVIA